MAEPDLADAKDRKQAPTFPKLYEAARSWWAAPAFFLLLSVVYFAEFVFSDHVLAGLDLGTNLHRGNESFLDKVSLLEPANWSNRTGAGRTQLYMMNRDGSGTERLTNDPGRSTEPAWSPDGENLMFTSNRPGNNEIYRLRIRSEQ